MWQAASQRQVRRYSVTARLLPKMRRWLPQAHEQASSPLARRTSASLHILGSGLTHTSVRRLTWLSTQPSRTVVIVCRMTHHQAPQLSSLRALCRSLAVQIRPVQYLCRPRSTA